MLLRAVTLNASSNFLNAKTCNGEKPGELELAVKLID